MRKKLRKVLHILLYPFVVVVAQTYKYFNKFVKNKTIKIKHKDIVDGFSYLVIKDTEVEKVATKRAETCAGCRFAEYIGNHKTTITVKDKLHTYKSMKCGVCGCALAAKVRAMEDNCPLNKWEAHKITK